jgi:Tfp pilus assembly protein PilN
MITLNLLNEAEKNNIKKDRLINLIKNGLFYISLSLAFSGILVLASNKILSDNLEDLKKEAGYISEQNLPFDEKITAINSKLSSADFVQKNFIRWSEIIYSITNTIPPGVEFKNLSLNKNNKIEINGISDNRDNFLLFKKNLEESKIVKNIDSPLTNILYQTNFEFSLSATLNFE